MEVCSSGNAETRAKKPKGKGKGKPSKCPTVATVVDAAKEMYAGKYFTVDNLIQNGIQSILKERCVCSRNWAGLTVT